MGLYFTAAVRAKGKHYRFLASKISSKFQVVVITNLNYRNYLSIL